MRKYFIFFIFLTTMISCDHKLSPEKYEKWLKNCKNGYCIQKVNGEYLFSLQYYPPEWIQYTQNDTINNDQKNNMAHFTFEIGLKDGGDLFQYMTTDPDAKDRLVYYLSYEMQNDLKLLLKDTSYPCVLYHFERSFDLQGSRQFIFTFLIDQPLSDDFSVVYRPQFLKDDTIVFKFNDKKLLPKLRL